MRMDGLEELKTQIRGIEIPICIVSACIFRVESFDEGQEAGAEFTCLHCWCRLAEIASSTIDYDRGTGGKPERRRSKINSRGREMQNDSGTNTTTSSLLDPINVVGFIPTSWGYQLTLTVLSYHNYSYVLSTN